MLEEGGAVFPVGEQDGDGVVEAGYGAEQLMVGVADVVRLDVVIFRQFRKGLGKEAARLHLVGDAGGNPEVILENNPVVAGLHQIHSVDVDEGVLRRTETLQVGVEVVTGEDDVGRHHILSTAIEVNKEHVEGALTLAYACFDGFPVVLGDDARQKVGGRGPKLLGVEQEGEGVAGDPVFGGVTTGAEGFDSYPVDR